MTKHIRHLSATLFLGSALLTGSITSASDVTDDIDTRQKGFIAIAEHLKTMKGLEDDSDTHWAQIKGLALESGTIVKKMSFLFPEGSATGSRSKDSVWAKWDQFEQGLMDLGEQIDGMNSAANMQDINALKKAFNAADRSCKSCHRVYRSKW